MRDHHLAVHDQLVSIRVRRLAEAQNWRCCYCSCVMDILKGRPRTATRDHIIPRCLAGGNADDNLVAACQPCNLIRGFISAIGFWRVMTGGFAHREDLWPDRFGVAGG